ncbi:HD family phosphohydrolase [Alicyclobacillus ferrooxydans]|uniref:Metal-dependent phosphohydrolase n=1 Tax=Alicyclobacillus ferrooxydans TaxID=471514 RepID=A0A0P9C6Y0_9BACL|nr:HDIG domain-containing metalloprotein [Alicyclobacillus ferrooxydans]KPV38958.1 metal-dependent phosphohydrolase [Alicyclobacillus ferrooxydans]
MWSKWMLAIRQFLDDEKFRENKRIRHGLYVALGVVLYIVLIGTVLPPTYDFRVNETSPLTIRAPITAVNTFATNKAKQAAMAAVQPIFTLDPTKEINAKAEADTLYDKAIQLVGNPSLSSTSTFNQLKLYAPPKVSASTLQVLLTMDPQQILNVKQVSDSIISNLLSTEFTSESMSQASLLVDQAMLGDNLDNVSRLVVQDVVTHVLQPNLKEQTQETTQKRQQAANETPDVYIHQGDVIVSKSGVITSTVLSELKDVGLYGTHPDYSILIGFALFMLIAVGLLRVYIEHRPSRRRIDNLLLLILILILALMSILILVTKDIINGGGPSSAAYLMPISMGAMLITVLVDASLAVVTSFFLSLLFGAAMGYDFWFTFIGVVASLVGGYSVERVTHRGTFMRAGFLVSMMNIVAILAMQLLLPARTTNLHSLWVHLGIGGLNGLVSAILTMGILPFFENSFGLLTPIRLLELSNPGNPLLKKLLMEAPGTYHHSLIVGNLAEAAAEIVGADPLICRVGAYYHDVGKMRRPAFFVENQMTKENPHDKIAPSLSHLIITSHVTDGLEMLEKAGLPKPIRDICATHHGTTILWYFYNKAREQDKNGSVHVDDYRYPGPKPKTRENAILMICDAVEAAVRSMSKPTPGRIEGVIRKIIRDRLQDGQLDECDLTLQDLDAMVGAFMKTLKGIYHSRIEYPDPDKIRKEVAK